MEVEIIKMGRGNESLPHGTIINVTCIAGHRLNIGNRTAKCVRGRWKPKEPECLTCTYVVFVTSLEKIIQCLYDRVYTFLKVSVELS